MTVIELLVPLVCLLCWQGSATLQGGSPHVQLLELHSDPPPMEPHTDSNNQTQTQPDPMQDGSFQIGDYDHPSQLVHVSACSAGNVDWWIRSMTSRGAVQDDPLGMGFEDSWDMQSIQALMCQLCPPTLFMMYANADAGRTQFRCSDVLLNPTSLSLAACKYLSGGLVAPQNHWDVIKPLIDANIGRLGGGNASKQTVFQIAKKLCPAIGCCLGDARTVPVVTYTPP